MDAIEEIPIQIREKVINNFDKLVIDATEQKWPAGKFVGFVYIKHTDFNYESLFYLAYTYFNSSSECVDYFKKLLKSIKTYGKRI